MSLDVKIYSPAEIRGIVARFPDITYSEEFFCFAARAGLKGGYLGISVDGKLCAILPITYNDTECYGVYKYYTLPYLTGAAEFDWSVTVNLMRAKLGFKLVDIRLAGLPDLPTQGLRRTPFSTYILDLNPGEDIQAIMNRFEKKTRNEVRKGQKSGLTVRLSGVEDLDKIYALYQKNMARHGTPAKGRGFFEDLFACLGQSVRAVTVWDGEALVAANVFMFNQARLRLLFNISEEVYWTHCVNNLAYMQTIEFAVNEGIGIVDFEGGPDSDSSHSHFKLGFGANRYPIYELKSASLSYMLKVFWNKKLRNLKIRRNRLFR